MEMFSNEQLASSNNIYDKSSLSPKRSGFDLLNDGNQEPTSRNTPFRTDAKQYMDKVLNLMTMINEVDDLTNMAELKNKL